MALLTRSSSVTVKICGQSASGTLKVILVVLTNIPIKIGLHLQVVSPVNTFTENTQSRGPGSARPLA